MNANSVTVAAFGDSLFEGWGINPGQAAPVVLEQLLQEANVTASVLNFGVCGETAAEGLSRIKRVIESRPTLTLVEFGANDFYQLVPPKHMQAQLASIIEMLMNQGSLVLLIGIRCLAEFTGEQYKTQFDPIFSGLAKRFSIPLVPDIFAAYLNDPTMLQADGIHPNKSGAKAIARMILPPVLYALTGAE